MASTLVDMGQLLQIEGNNSTVQPTSIRASNLSLIGLRGQELFSGRKP